MANISTKINKLSEKNIDTLKNSSKKVFYELKTLEENYVSNSYFKILKNIILLIIIFIIIINILQIFKLLSKNLINIFKPVLFISHVNNVNNNEKESTINKIKQDINKKQKNNIIPQPNESNNNDNSKTIGFCYVGTDQGYRSCIDINNENECLSGDIFPTKDICINPNLRQ